MMPYNPLAWNMTEFLELAWVDRRYERLGGVPSKCTPKSALSYGAQTATQGPVAVLFLGVVIEKGGVLKGGDAAQGGGGAE